MQTSVTFKNIEPSDHLKAYVSDKLNRFDRLLDNPAEAYVVLSVEKHRHISEIKLIGDRLNINGKEETNDMYSAIDMALDKLEKQIKKGKQKVRDKRGNTRTGALAVQFEKKGASDEESATEIIVKTVDYKPMDAEEAVMQLDLADEKFLVFSNARTDEINVVYRRSDGHYGLIQPRR